MISENERFLVYMYIYIYMENIYIFIDSIFLGNWIAGFRGFKLMEINVATAVFQVHFYVYSWKRKDQKTVQVEG